MEYQPIVNSKFISARDLSLHLDSCAVVSVIFRQTDQLEILFIRRARNPEDRWSGQIAFPGGRMENNETHLQTALRECQEEIGVDLRQAKILGALDDIQARKAGGLLPFYVRPMVFHLPKEIAPFTLDPSEVDEVFWLPFQELLIEKNHQDFYPNHSELRTPTAFPSILLSTGDHLWGLSYVMLTDLLNKTGQRPQFWKEYFR